jgi:hypothetical protein
MIQAIDLLRIYDWLNCFSKSQAQVVAVYTEIFEKLI